MSDPLTSTQLQQIQDRIGYLFHSSPLLQQALTHKSFTNETTEPDSLGHNECLEFLGDAVLGLVVSVFLMNERPHLEEGALSRMRAALVNKQELAAVAQQIALGDLMRLGKGEEKSGGRCKASLLADCFEALLGAVFLDGGLDAATDMVQRMMGDRMASLHSQLPGFDPKSRLQEILQQQGLPPPSYRLLMVSGPDHQRNFEVSVYSGDEELGRGAGTNKKEAEQAAARQALSHHADNPSTPEKQNRPQDP